MCGKLVAHEGQGTELAQILLEAAESMNNVEGCEMYVVSVSNADPDTIWVTEVWKDEAARLRVLGGKGL